MNASTAFVSARRSGRCANGAERDGGTVIHLIDTYAARRADAVGSWEPAVCGVRPGRASNGWSTARTEAATCPRCLMKAAGNEPIKAQEADRGT